MRFARNRADHPSSLQLQESEFSKIKKMMKMKSWRSWKILFLNRPLKPHRRSVNYFRPRTTIPRTQIFGQKSKDLSDVLALMLAKDKLPYDFGKHEGFKAFIRVAVPGYKIPGRTKITAMLDLKYLVLKDITIKKFEGAAWISLHGLIHLTISPIWD